LACLEWDASDAVALDGKRLAGLVPCGSKRARNRVSLLGNSVDEDGPVVAIRRSSNKLIGAFLRILLK